ncbi:Glycoside hydrolase family 1 [Sesbania bispinosa]|nr:Glycoside hydrolase family 1 [Sesbania bispinosa]
MHRQDFAYYAELCFSEFGDRVKYWITINEPLIYSLLGYTRGLFPPARCSKWVSPNCTAGDSSTEPYLVSHHLILAHAAAVKVYKEKYQIFQQGQIGIALYAPWVLPLSQSKIDKDAASRALAFMYDWFMEPLYSAIRNGVLNGPKARPDWPYIYPRGIQDMLEYTKEKFNNPTIYITENGLDEVNDGTKSSLDDKLRIYYISEHLLYIQRAIRNGVKVKGYFTWSLLDNFEWNNGYTVGFGIVVPFGHLGEKKILDRDMGGCYGGEPLLVVALQHVEDEDKVELTRQCYLETTSRFHGGDCMAGGNTDLTAGRRKTHQCVQQPRLWLSWSTARWCGRRECTAAQHGPW